MKYILMSLFVCSVSLSNSQSWKFSSGGNSFDGSYRSASVVGKGSNYPYTSPRFVINLFNENDLNIYLSDSGYFSDESRLEVLIVFNQNRSKLFRGANLSVSKDGKTVFIKSIMNDEGKVYNSIEFIEKIKESKKMEIRVSSQFDDNDLTFSLAGSNSAISKTVTDDFLKNIADLQRELDEVNQKLKDLTKKHDDLQQIEKERIKLILVDLGFEGKELLDMVTTIEINARFSKYLLKDVATIETPYQGVTGRVFTLILWDSDSNELSRFVSASSNYNQHLTIGLKAYKLKQLKLQTEKDSIERVNHRIESLKIGEIKTKKVIEKYKFDSLTQKSILKDLELSFNDKYYNIRKIDSVNIIQPTKKGKIIMRFYNSNGEWIFSLNDIEYSKEFTKKIKRGKVY